MSRSSQRLTHPEIYASTLRLLEALTAVSSPSGDRDGLLKALSLYGEHLSDRGLDVEIRPRGDDHLPVLSASISGSLDGGLLVIGHMDTVLPAAEPRFDDDRLWATGAVDMKGGLACFVGAVDQLQAEGTPLPEDLVLVVVPDEEVAGPLSWQTMKELGAGARGLWVLEPGQPFGESGETAVLGRRGLITWAFDVTGRAAHAGNGFWDGRSALVAAAEWSVAAAALASPGAGPTVSPARFVAGERDFVENPASRADLLFSPRQTNVVSDRARVEGEMRFLTPQEGTALVEELGRLAREIGERREVETRFETLKDVPPLHPQDAGRSWAKAAADLAAGRGWELAIEEDRRGISFPNMLPDPSAVPTLDGLGPVGGGMHTREEFVDLRSVDRRILLLADLLRQETARG